MKNEKTILNLMIIVSTLFIMLVVGDNIMTSLQGSAIDTQNYEKRKKYFEEFIEPSNLDLHPARYYIKIEG